MASLHPLQIRALLREYMDMPSIYMDMIIEYMVWFQKNKNRSKQNYTLCRKDT
jgi:hypothetical protein